MIAVTLPLKIISVANARLNRMVKFTYRNTLAVGCESPLARGISRNPARYAAFSISAPSFGGSDGMASAMPVTLRVPRSLTPIRAAAPCESGTAVVHQAQLEQLMKWTQREDEIVRTMYRTHTRAGIATVLGRTEGMIRSRCWTLGLASKIRPWNLEDLAELVSAYAIDKPAVEVNLDSLAAKFGRHKSNVSRKARALGLTNQNRPMVRPEDLIIRIPMFSSNAERSAHQSNIVKARIIAQGHPRGALGMKHSEASKLKMASAIKKAWADPESKFNSEAHKQQASDRMVQRIANGEMNAGYSRTRGGKRADLNCMYFRSAWEANYARYLNHLKSIGEISGWLYEAKTFVFTEIQRGTRAYTPDFKVLTDGGHEWHEVKGWMDQKSKEKLALMKQFFPDEKLLVIDAIWFRSANKSDFHINLAGWEKGTTR